LKEKIPEFFDGMAIDIDSRIGSDPIPNYEQRMRQLQIGELMEIEKGDLILDAGCGNLRDANLFLKNKAIRYVGIDFSSNMLKEGQSRCLTKLVYLTLGDITSLPFRNDCFDLALCPDFWSTYRIGGRCF